MRQLAARRADLRAELASAETPQDQAAAARQLASAYDEAARALASNRVAAAAGTAADAYSDLAAAGEANDASGIRMPRTPSRAPSAGYRSSRAINSQNERK